jgi:hypothetical protein
MSPRYVQSLVYHVPYTYTCDGYLLEVREIAHAQRQSHARRDIVYWFGETRSMQAEYTVFRLLANDDTARSTVEALLASDHFH